MFVPPSPETIGQTVYRRLREDIVFGRLEPGMKLRLERLRDRYDVSVATLRELLPRLVAEGLIEKQSDDTLRLVYNLPGGEAPDDFKADKNQQMFILKAYEGDKDAPKAKRQ